jgi:hypothetical protein
VWFAGVPPMPDFTKRFEMRLLGRGVDLDVG